MVSESKTVMYRGKIIDLTCERVTLPNGRIADLEIVNHPGGAAVVAIDADQRICLLRQYRYAAGGWLWELPAGKLDAGESPLATARRELQEEAGLAARRWDSLGKIISSPGVFTEIVHLYLARDLSPVPENLEEHELIEVHWIPLTQAISWSCTEDILDAKTLIGLFRAAKIVG